MKEILREANALITEMNALEKFNDDIFIAFYEKEDAMQESLLAAEKAGKLSAEERKDYSDRLAEAFAKLRGKLSFCNLK